MQIVITFRDHVLKDFANRLEKLGSGQGFGILAQALNEGGKSMKQNMQWAEAAQTTLSPNTMERAYKETPASPGDLTYTLTTRGGNVRLKYFGAKEGGGGVTAHPWGKSTFYPGAFITSGRPGNRRPSPKLNGQVYRNVAGGAWGGSIQQVKSGLFIPEEMTKGQTRVAYEAGAVKTMETVISRLGSLLP